MRISDWSSDVCSSDLPPGDSKPLSDVRILPPILYPGEIWAAGANYQDHISEMGESEYKAVNAKTVSGGRAWHFAKPSRSTLVAHGSTNPLPWYSEQVDWEIDRKSTRLNSSH